MSIYYIEDKNGKYYSIDKKRRFRKLTGISVSIYLKSKEAEGKRFARFAAEDENGEDVYIEIPPDKIKEYRKGERREQYVTDCERDANFITISLDAFQDEHTEDEIYVEEYIPDLNADTWTEVLRSIEQSDVVAALEKLSKEEYELIQALYLSPMRSTQSEQAKRLNISQSAVSQKKRRILMKLKKFLKNF